MVITGSNCFTDINLEFFDFGLSWKLSGRSIRDRRLSNLFGFFEVSAGLDPLQRLLVHLLHQFLLMLLSLLLGR